MAFFDKIGQTITSGVSTVSDSTKSLAENTKLNSQINATKTSLAKAYEEIGKYYYNNRNGSISSEALESMCADVDRLKDELHDMELRYKLAKGFVPCSNCGSDVSVNSTFCANCGTRVTIPKLINADVPEGKKKCVKCGSIENADTKFCSSCGTKMPEETASAAAVEEPKQESRVCPKCGITMPIEMKFCSSCGTKLDDEQPKSEEKPAEVIEIAEPVAATAPAEEAVASDAAPDVSEAPVETSAPVEEAPVAEETIETASAEDAHEEAASANADNTLKCSACGSELTEGSRFCMECGTPVAAAGTAPVPAEPTEEKTPVMAAASAPAPATPSSPEAVSPADSKVCSKCGKVEPDNMRFCSECGNKL